MFLVKIQSLVYRYLQESMNKSIMKTRNQLQRITQKINQLKNKYSCQNLDQFPNDSYNRSVALTPSNNKKAITQESLKNILAGSSVCNQQNINLTCAEQNNFQDIYRKQFKLFRNELYQYLDHQLSRVKSRDNQIQAQLQEFSQQLQERKVENQQLVQDRNRIRKIQEKVSSLIGLTEQLSFRQKKGQSEIQKRFKRIYQRVIQVQENQRQQIQKIMPDLKNEILASISKHLQQNQGKKQNIQKCIIQKLRVLQQNNEKVEKAIKKVQGQCQKLKNQVVELRVFNEKNDQLLQEAIRQTQHNKIETLRQIKHVEQRINQRQALSNNFSNMIKEFDSKLHEKESLITKTISTLLKTQFESIVQRTEQKYLIIEHELKSTRKSLFQDIQLRFNQNQKKWESITTQFEQNILSINQCEKPVQFNLQFNQEICNQIKMMHQSYSKLAQQCKQIKTYSKQKCQSLAAKLDQLQKQEDLQLQNLKSYGKAFEKLSKEFYSLKISSLVSKVEDLQQKQKQVEQTSVKRPQLSKVLTIVQTFNLKMEEIEEKCLKSQGQMKDKINSVLSQIQKFQSNICESKVQQETELIQVKISQIINQQLIKNDQKLSILNQNIIQSAQQFKEYIEQSEQCYNAIQSTIKILSDNLHQITENQQNIDKTCRRMILKTQEKLIEKLQKQFKDRNPDIKLQKRSQIELNCVIIRQRLEKIQKDIKTLQIDVLQFNKHSKTDLEQIQVVSDKQIQTFQIQLPPNVKIFVDLIQQSINNMKKSIMLQISNEIVSVKQYQVNGIKQYLQQLNSKIEFFNQASNNLIHLNRKNHQMDEKMQQIQRSMVEVVSDLEFLLKQRNEMKQPQRNIKLEGTQSSKILILQQQINFIKRNLIDGQGAQKQNNALKKFKNQFEQFKEKQQQQQSRLKSIVSNEVYKNMAGQFTKISQILERTFQQLQQKHAKMQYHLNCFNQRILALQNGQKVIYSQAKQSICFSTVSQKHNFQSPSKMLSSISANTIDINSRISDNQK